MLACVLMCVLMRPQVKKYQFKSTDLLYAWAEPTDTSGLEVRVAVNELTAVKKSEKVSIVMGNVVPVRFCPDESFVVLCLHGFPSGTGIKKAK